MLNIMLEYAYDGSFFYGSQKQPGKRTVQGEIEKGIRALTKENIRLITAGRTDRGVHALKQVSNFYTESNIPIPNFFYALSRKLPDDIKLINMKEVDLEFNARFDAKNRSYKYIITNEKNPFNARYMTYLPINIEIAKLQEILNTFVGIHDFTNFMLVDKAYKNPVREIYDVKVERNESQNIEIYIKGSSFLKSQVRLMIGGAISVLRDIITKEQLLAYIENPTLKNKKDVASATGLYLCDIEF
ncbi:tRNA pseudouridine(38-40) synthase TruA [Fusobacterium sp. PH5-44]|uniref:tRNA pseudouridine(38-40) synthase TruA n=1 Tax=unclassified Fusobacterium TaxID=2648384 RepID=UPI003D195A1A